MRKTLFMALCLIGIMSLFSAEIKAQQYQSTLVSTVASFKDTTKNYTYTNVYAVVQSTNFSRGTMVGGMGMPGVNQDSASFKKWSMNYNVAIYSNETAYREGKQSISYWTGNVLLTQSFPTEAEILTAIKNHLPK